MTAFLLAVAVLGLAAVLGVRSAVRHYGGGRLAWRWFTGAHLDGRYHTNAGWLARGTKVHHPSGRAGWWAHTPRLARAGVRWAVILVPLACLATWAAVRAVAEVAIPAALVTLLAFAAWRAGRRVRVAAHRRRTVRPLAAALAVPLESTPAEVARTLAVPRKIGPASEVTAALPDHWQGSPVQMDAATRIVAHRLGHEWAARVSRSPFVLIVHRRPEPPGRVEFGEVAELIRREGSASRVLLGLGTGREPVWLDAALSPHAGLSVGTGGGKSAWLRLVVAQLSYHGVADFPCLDAKGVSLAGMESLPGLRVYRDDREQWELIGRLLADMQARYAAMLADPAATFPATFLIGDEMNDAAISWRMTWDSMRAAGELPARSPATPPVYNDLTRLLVKGRECGYRVALAFQRLTAAACGGMNAGVFRDALGTKCLSRFGPAAWDTLTGIRPRADSSQIPGRWVIVAGADVRQVQVPYAEADELLAFAASGRAYREAWANVPPVRVVQTPPAGGAGETGTPEPAREAVVIGLADAAARLRMTPEGFRKARQRKPIGGEFRTADGRPAWPLADLTAWAQSRPLAGEGYAEGVA